MYKEHNIRASRKLHSLLAYKAAVQSDWAEEALKKRDFNHDTMDC